MRNGLRVRRLRSGHWAVFCIACGHEVQSNFRTRDEAEGFIGPSCAAD